jgi:hypothetical protein
MSLGGSNADLSVHLQSGETSLAIQNVDNTCIDSAFRFE